ncbi:helix-turn-helix domain-containing protein [Trueperella sp. LYQ143]|uniref:helix-turn-helix domain-containing protein n=1 Tax=unclassified Trueperella TaxID=2630174 RepID=UPI003983C2C8
MTIEPLLTIKEAAKILKTTPNTIYRYAWSDQLETVKIGGRRLITPESLQAFINRHIDTGQTVIDRANTATSFERPWLSSRPAGRSSTYLNL